MTLRSKLVIALGALAALATLTLGLLTYRATERTLMREINASLDETADYVARLFERPGSAPADLPVMFAGDRLGPDRGGPPLADPDGDGDGRGPRGGRPRLLDQTLIQLVAEPDPAVAATGATGPIPIPIPTPEPASRGGLREGRHVYDTIEYRDERYRAISVGTGNGVVVQAARSLTETDRVLGSLRQRALLTGLIVSAVAAVLGWWIARQVTRRLTALTATAEQVASTGRLDVAVPVDGRDEAGRLGSAFAGMLSALASSREAQMRLVQDAGHELRTPLTSLRTNIATLQRHERMDDATRRSILSDLDGETRELTGLVNELVELATDSRADEPVETVRLDDVAHRIAERAARRTGRVVVVTGDGSAVEGRMASIERAISNLVDNALKFDPAGDAPVEVTLVAGRIEVADRGPGIPAEDLPRVFDRFHRSLAARSTPGSGLGLSIVREVAERHGGSVFAHPRSGGGSIVGFTLPGSFQPDSHPIHDPVESPGGTMADNNRQEETSE